MLHSPSNRHSVNNVPDSLAGPTMLPRSSSRSPNPPHSPTKFHRQKIFGNADAANDTGGDIRDTLQLPTSSAWMPGMQVVAQYNFKGTSSEDLPFHKGQILLIAKQTKDANWYVAENDAGDRGLVPANYVIPYDVGGSLRRRGPAAIIENNNGTSVSPPVEVSTAQVAPAPVASHSSNVWYHERISREETEQLLSDKLDGTFLIRDSTNYPGDFTLCLAFEGKVEHYRIHRQKGMLTCDEEEYFESLAQLVTHYKRDADGLCHRLVSALPTSRHSLGVGEDQRDAIVQQTKVFKNNGWTIHRHELSLGDTIGHGEFGDVLIGWYREQKVAVKVLKHSSGVVESLLEEAALMTSLRHANLVQLLGVVLDDVNDVFMVTQFMANGNLVDYLRSRGRHQVDRNQLLQFAIDVCNGMAYLESRQLVHRDLAARNILLSADMIANISDFGLAKHADKSSLETSGKFPIKWTAPEALRHSLFTNKSDMWSFGVLLWEIYSFGRVPYPRIPIQDVIRHIEKGYRMEPPEACPKSVAAHMTAAWAFRPLDRPTFADMLFRLRETQQQMEKEPSQPCSPTTPAAAPPGLPPPPPLQQPPSTSGATTIALNNAVTQLTVSGEQSSSSSSTSSS